MQVGDAARDEPWYAIDDDLQRNRFLRAAGGSEGKVMIDNCTIFGSPGNAVAMPDRMAASLDLGSCSTEDSLHWLDSLRSTLDAILPTFVWQGIVAIARSAPDNAAVVVALPSPLAAATHSLTRHAAAGAIGGFA